MASDVGVGDSETPLLTVQPADGTTQVTLTVTPPAGDPVAVTMTGGDFVDVDGTDPIEQKQTWAADPVTYTAAGKWVLSYTVTGTGEGAEEQEVYVVATPTAGGPTWTPGRSRVAAYIPHRTLVRSTASTVSSADSYAWTWDETTTPPGGTVDRLIADGVAWVSARVYPMAATSEATASVCAALYAAAMIERSWPQDDQALARADALERRLDVLLNDLVEANGVASDTGEFGLEIVPMWAYPPADPRYDSSCYW